MRSQLRASAATVGDGPSDTVFTGKALGSYLSAFEGMSGNAVRAALGHLSSLRNPFPGGIVREFMILAEISRTNAPRDGE
ncbi:hypothetical protein [Bradyrhizobium sp. Arg816]|uniref:hypothetical protein n=1 Tax=Bradyrhizobium sp. Arg816 TaxID=2998491 RepID=UPI00249E0D86|nr:hypothetical protein [Bradyrhizobium sp. Arg816]MDI3567187.1 hypothetical protein [Bradyrhizobium sp. Arg816]